MNHSGWNNKEKRGKIQQIDFTTVQCHMVVYHCCTIIIITMCCCCIFAMLQNKLEIYLIIQGQLSVTVSMKDCWKFYIFTINLFSVYISHRFDFWQGLLLYLGIILDSRAMVFVGLMVLYGILFEYKNSINLVSLII